MNFWKFLYSSGSSNSGDGSNRRTPCASKLASSIFQPLPVLHVRSPAGSSSIEKPFVPRRHSISGGSVVPVPGSDSAPSISKVLEFLGVDGVQETSEIIHLINPSQYYSTHDTIATRLRNIRVSASSPKEKEDDSKKKDNCIHNGFIEESPLHYNKASDMSTFRARKGLMIQHDPTRIPCSSLSTKDSQYYPGHPLPVPSVLVQSPPPAQIKPYQHTSTQRSRSPMNSQPPDISCPKVSQRCLTDQLNKCSPKSSKRPNFLPSNSRDTLHPPEPIHSPISAISPTAKSFYPEPFTATAKTFHPSSPPPFQLPRPSPQREHGISQSSGILKTPSQTAQHHHHPHPLKASPLQSPLHSPRSSALNTPWPLVSLPQCPFNWIPGERLGQGSFGAVFEGQNTDNGSFFAVKISSEEDNSVQTQQEIAVMSQLNHPNIVQYLGSAIKDGKLYIFLELVKMGSLRSILEKYGRLDESVISAYTRQLLYGLRYLHSNNTIHRDIKCANILVDVNGQVKLADFGVAKILDPSVMAHSCKGTPVYMAPEVMKPKPGQKSYGFLADIWSLGCTVIEMADGKPPWSDSQGFAFLFRLNKGELPPIPEHLSLVAKDFISNCLKLNPEKRWNASQLLKHPFVANAPKTLPHLPFLEPPSPSHSLLRPKNRSSHQIVAEHHK